MGWRLGLAGKSAGLCEGGERGVPVRRFGVCGGVWEGLGAATLSSRRLRFAI